ncbi:hypothetical protein JCM10450v2_003838 [Rhodotorula kratochvilovae]
MGAILSKPREVDYDTVLSKLQTQIAARQARLQQIRLRERRANALFITYGLALWILYSVLWYFGIVGGRHGPWQVAAASGAPVVLGPVAIIFTRRASRWFYHRKQDKEEAQLKVLLKQKSDKVEEIKKKTGYYSTRDLLEKYDEALKKGPASNPATPAKQPANGAVKPAAVPFPGTPGTPNTPNTPARPGTPASAETPQRMLPSAPGTPAQLPFPPAAGVPPAFPAPPLPPAPPATPQPRSLMDKLADALLGVSPEEANPMNRYALICGQCFAHNGLARKEEFDFVQYRCPRCGYFNPPRRAPSSSALAANDPHRHRRVVSEFAPSPLGGSFAQPARAQEGAAQVGREEEVEEASPLEAGEMKEVERETSTSALKEGGEARRRTRKTVEGGGEEDRMDTD